MNHRVSVGFIALVLILGCDGRRSPTSPQPKPSPPIASTPANLLHALEWSFYYRDTLIYRTLFTADYRFRFYPGDTTGNRYPDRALDRVDELRFGRTFFVLGSAVEPAPARIYLSFNPAFDYPDSRPGTDTTVHREIRAATVLRVELPDLEVLGPNRFFVVRGDSAEWPAGLEHSGPDSTRWFIQEWRDETLDDWAPGLRAMPAHPITLGLVKGRYLQ